MPRLHHRIIAHLVSTIFLASLFLPTAHVNAAPTEVSTPQAPSETDVPLGLSLSATPADGDNVTNG